MNKEFPDWYLLKCECGAFATDYPFVSCSKCNYINCGSSEQLEEAKEKGFLMKTLDSGKDYEWSYTKLLEKHKLKSIRVEFHHGMATDPFGEDNYDDFDNEDYLDLDLDYPDEYTDDPHPFA